MDNLVLKVKMLVYNIAISFHLNMNLIISTVDSKVNGWTDLNYIDLFLELYLLSNKNKNMFDNLQANFKLFIK